MPLPEVFSSRLPASLPSSALITSLIDIFTSDARHGSVVGVGFDFSPTPLFFGCPLDKAPKDVYNKNRNFIAIFYGLKGYKPYEMDIS